MINCHLLESCCEHLWRGLKDLNLRASAEANGLANHRIKPLCQIPKCPSVVRMYYESTSACWALTIVVYAQFLTLSMAFFKPIFAFTVTFTAPSLPSRANRFQKSGQSWWRRRDQSMPIDMNLPRRTSFLQAMEVSWTGL